MIKEDLKVTEQNMYSVYPKEEIKGKGKDLTNFQCNDILVLYKTSSIKIGKTTKAAWVCKCLDCGNIIKRRADYLYQKRIISCGCKNFPGPVDIKDKQFGTLTAIKIDHYDKNNGYIWECNCQCGNSCLISYCNLNTNRITQCPKCSKREAMIKLGKEGSKGSQIIENLLITNKINYEKEWNYKDLKDSNYLFYDFYLPDYNILIEFDGEQHYKASKTSFMCKDGKFEKIRFHDNLKNNYAKEHHITLIRVPFWKIDNINIKDLINKNSRFSTESHN